MTNRAAQKRMNDVATVWPASGVSDDYGNTQYGDPYMIACNYLEGGKLARDDKGDEFMPSATIRTLNINPKKEDLILLGDHLSSGTPSGIGAQRIRKRRSVTKFRGVQQSIALLTGN